MIRICEVCKKEFSIRPSFIKRGGGRGRFCSLKCQGISRSKFHRKEKNPNWKGGKVKRKCQICGKDFRVHPSKIKQSGSKFCSRRCSTIQRLKQMKKKDTLPELLLEQELIKYKIPYIKQAPIEGIALADFLLPNKTIVEVDGIFWHSLPGRKEKDNHRDSLLNSKGYKIFRFSDLEIKNSPTKCLQELINGLDRGVIENG